MSGQRSHLARRADEQPRSDDRDAGLPEHLRFLHRPGGDLIGTSVAPTPDVRHNLSVRRRSHRRIRDAPRDPGDLPQLPEALGELSSGVVVGIG